MFSDSLQFSFTGSTVRGSNPGGAEIYRTGPDRPWGPPSPKTMDTGSFPPVQRSGRGARHPPATNVEVKEVELHLYSSSGPSWSILGSAVPLFLVHCAQLSKHSSLRLRIRATCPLHMNHAYTTSIFRSIADYKVVFSLEISKLSLTFKLKVWSSVHVYHAYSPLRIFVQWRLHKPRNT